jgi:hypothetical protein
MQAIEKRIAALEQASPVRDQITVIWRVRTDQPDAEIHRITADDGECTGSAPTPTTPTQLQVWAQY